VFLLNRKSQFAGFDELQLVAKFGPWNPIVKVLLELRMVTAFSPDGFPTLVFGKTACDGVIVGTTGGSASVMLPRSSGSGDTSVGLVLMIVSTPVSC
jgi:hypothetical protein